MGPIAHRLGLGLWPSDHRRCLFLGVWSVHSSDQVRRLERRWKTQRMGEERGRKEKLRKIEWAAHGQMGRERETVSNWPLCHFKKKNW